MTRSARPATAETVATTEARDSSSGGIRRRLRRGLVWRPATRRRRETRTELGSDGGAQQLLEADAIAQLGDQLGLLVEVKRRWWCVAPTWHKSSFSDAARKSFRGEASSHRQVSVCSSRCCRSRRLCNAAHVKTNRHGCARLARLAGECMSYVSNQTRSESRCVSNQTRVKFDTTEVSQGAGVK